MLRILLFLLVPFFALAQNDYGYDPVFEGEPDFIKTEEDNNKTKVFNGGEDLFGFVEQQNKANRLDFNSIQGTKTNKARLQILNKITTRVIIKDIDINQSHTTGRITVTPQNCTIADRKKTNENLAFLKVKDNDPEQGEIDIFTGWLLSENTALSQFEHPIYDIVLVQCVN